MIYKDRVEFVDKIVEVEKVVIKEVEKLVKEKTNDAKMIESTKVIAYLKEFVEEVIADEKRIGVPVGYL